MYKLSLYRLSEDEVLENFPYSKVLQLKWKSELGKYAIGVLNGLRKKHIKKEEVNLKALQEEIDKFVTELREKYPKEFPTIGWWDKKQAKVLMKDSAVKGRGEFEVCKVCGIKLPDRNNAGVAEIEGELWVVHRRCVNRLRKEEG